MRWGHFYFAVGNAAVRSFLFFTRLRKPEESLSCIESQYVEGKCPLCHDPWRCTPCLPFDKCHLEGCHKIGTKYNRQNAGQIFSRCYFRVLVRRKEVNRRHVKQEQEQLLRLNEYAQYEEEHFERCKDNKRRKAWYHSVEVMLLNIVVSAVLVAGVGTFVRRG